MSPVVTGVIPKVSHHLAIHNNVCNPDSVTTQILRLIVLKNAHMEITVLVNTQLEPLAWMDFANASTTQGGTDVLASVREIVEIKLTICSRRTLVCSEQTEHA